MAGQIALIPGSMQLLQHGARHQARLSLRHVSSVLAAMQTGDCPLHSICLLLCYVTRQQAIPGVVGEWEYALKEEEAREDAASLPPVIHCVVVPALPRGAAVEWQVYAVTDVQGQWRGKTVVNIL